jgi:hypothetical protein
MIAVGGQQLADERGRLLLRPPNQVVHQPADARHHVDGGVMAARGQIAQQPGMPV